MSRVTDTSEQLEEYVITRQQMEHDIVFGIDNDTTQQRPNDHQTIQSHSDD